MNLARLKDLEKQFLKKYPKGFDDPYFTPIAKKHKMEKMTDFAQDIYSKPRFKHPIAVMEDTAKLITRASMVSLFEKPKFRDFVHGLSAPYIKQFAAGIEKFLHTAEQQEGFEMMLDVLKKGKLAKWSLISAPGAYFAPQDEVFVKPTTAKGVVNFLELKNIEYQAQPTWEFYIGYRKAINAMKKKVAKSLSPSNAAFSGFLMMGLGKM